MSLRGFDRSEAVRLGKALTVSTTAAGGEVALFGAIVLVGIMPMLANVLAAVLGILIGFLLNRYWVFDAADARPAGQLARFTGVIVSSMALSTAIVGVCATVMHPVIGKVLSLPATFVWNYLLNRVLVFRA
jgi:putative flippase GtrA